MDTQRTPPAVNAPAQYSSLLPTGTAAGGIVSLASGSPVNFSGLQQGAVASEFTVGGWVRANAAFLAGQLSGADSFYPIFSNGQFSVGWTSGGLLACGFGLPASPLPTSWLDSSVPFADGTWHFVACSFAQSGAVGGGTLNLFVDGAMVATSTLSETQIGTGAPAALTLCPALTLGAGQVLDLVAWLIWSVTVPPSALAAPVWGAPPSGPLTSGLAAAFDFAAGAAVDQSGNQATVVVGAQQLNTPCLQLSSSSTALVPAVDGLNPGSSGEFSVMGWVGYPPNAADPIFLLVNDFADGTYIKIGIIQEPDQSAGTFQFILDNNTPGSGFSFLSNHFDAAGPWVHIAVTFSASANRFYLYAEGVLVNSWSPGDNGGGPWQTNAASTQITVCGAEQPTCFQGLSYWSSMLSQVQIEAIVARVDPTGTPSCAAAFSLAFPSPLGFADSIGGDGSLMTILTGTGVLGEVQSALTGSTAAALAARALVLGTTPLPTASARVFGVADYFALARAHGLDPDAPPPAALGSDPAYQASLAWYEGLLADVPEKLASCLRAQFQQRLSLGALLAEKAPQAGRFTRLKSDGKSCLMYNSTAGLVPAFADDIDPAALDTDELVNLCMNVAMDIFGLALSLVGLQSLAKALGRAVSKLGTITLEAVAKAAATAFKQASSQAANAAGALLNFLGKLSDAGSLGMVCWNLLYGMRWWEIAFAVVSFAGQLAAMLLSGGALLAIKIVNLAIGIVGLIQDLVALVNYLAEQALPAALPTPEPAR